MQEKTQPAIYQRFTQIANFYNISLRKLSELLELKSPQVFYDMKAGKVQSVSRVLLESVKEKLPAVNDIWLQTGDGEMMKSAPKNQQVIGNNNGTAINGDGAVVHPKEESADVVKRMQDQIDELLSQNRTLLNIVDRLTSK